jgi:hypothetical protein
MTILEVGGRVWRAAPARQTAQAEERSPAVLLVRRPRIHLIAAFLVADLAIFWFGLSMSGLTLSGSAGNGPRSLPATPSGAVVGSSGGSSRDPATGSLRSLSGAVVDINSGIIAAPAAAQLTQPAAAAASTTPTGSNPSKPAPGQATNPPQSPPKAPAPGLPGLLPAVDQAANHVVTGLIDILAPVVQTTQTTVTNLLPPLKLSLRGPS